MTKEESIWLDNASRRGGSFVKGFADCYYAADDANTLLLKPVLQILMKKYPSYLEKP